MNTSPQISRMPRAIGSHPSDSSVQRVIEIAMLSRLGQQHPDWQRVAWKTLAVEFKMSRVWQKTEPDAVWKTKSGIIVAECYSHIGELKAGQRRKLAMDALKLLALRDALANKIHIQCLLVVPEELMTRLGGEGWFPAALRLASDIIPVALLGSERKQLGEASLLQAQGQSRTKKVKRDRTDV